jgi:hypothetical protein
LPRSLFANNNRTRKGDGEKVCITAIMELFLDEKARIALAFKAWYRLRPLDQRLKPWLPGQMMSMKGDILQEGHFLLQNCLKAWWVKDYATSPKRPLTTDSIDVLCRDHKRLERCAALPHQSSMQLGCDFFMTVEQWVHIVSRMYDKL